MITIQGYMAIFLKQMTLHDAVSDHHSHRHHYFVHNQISYIM